MPGKPQQLAMRLDGRDRVTAATESLFQAIGDAVRIVSLKEVAFALDTSPSFLAHCIARRDQNHFRAEWLPRLADMGSRETCKALIEPVADLHNLELVPRAEMTPEEELARLKSAMATTLGPDVQQLIFAKVRAR